MNTDPERIQFLHRQGLSAAVTALSRASIGARAYERDGLVASIVPAAASDPDANMVTFTADAVADSALTTIAREYQASGVQSWEAYVPDYQHAIAQSLTRVGCTRRDRLGAILLDLAEFEPRPLGDLDYDASCPLPTLGRVNALAYERDGLARAFAHPPSDIEFRAYQARLNGEPASVLLTIDIPWESGRDCAAFFLATLPHARRRGLAPRLFTAALIEARARGCDTCSGQASAMGAPIYARMGFATHFYINRYQNG